jgi:hypothetical protein
MRTAAKAGGEGRVNANMNVNFAGNGGATRLFPRPIRNQLKIYLLYSDGETPIFFLKT